MAQDRDVWIKLDDLKRATDNWSDALSASLLRSITGAAKGKPRTGGLFDPPAEDGPDFVDTEFVDPNSAKPYFANHVSITGAARDKPGSGLKIDTGWAEDLEIGGHTIGIMMTGPAKDPATAHAVCPTCHRPWPADKDD